MTDRFPDRPGEDLRSDPAGQADFERLAARLGITLERVLQEVSRIAFARVTDIVEWDEKGLRFTDSGRVAEDDRAAIAEVVASAGDKKPYRIKMHDKRPALELIGRCLGMFPKVRPARKEDEQAQNDGEDPREILARKLARILEPERGEADAPGHAA